MNNKRKNKYKFHLKIDINMKEQLKQLPLFIKEGSLSKLIIKILILMSPGMENTHGNREQQFSKYAFVCDDKEIKRESIFVYLSDMQYQQIKLMHQDLNIYSMAQLIRVILRVFLNLARELGAAVESILLKFYHQWKEKRENRKYEWKPVEELLHFIYQKPRKSWFLTLYSKTFKPISIYRL